MSTSYGVERLIESLKLRLECSVCWANEFNWNLRFLTEMASGFYLLIVKLAALFVEEVIYNFEKFIELTWISISKGQLNFSKLKSPLKFSRVKSLWIFQIQKVR